jgi:hypothetical protein
MLPQLLRSEIIVRTEPTTCLTDKKLDRLTKKTSPEKFLGYTLQAGVADTHTQRYS